MEPKPITELGIIDLLPHAPMSPVSTCLFNIEDCFTWAKRYLKRRGLPVEFLAFPFAEMKVSRAMNILGFAYESGEYRVLDRPEMDMMLRVAHLDIDALDAILGKVKESHHAKS